MTREEILNQFTIVAVRRPVKGELILATKNHGSECEVVEVSADFKNVVSPILEPKKSVS